MAQHGNGISMSLSHTSDDSSSEQITPATHVGVGSTSHRRLPPSSAGNHPYKHQQLAPPSSQKKPRGRPPGSKNKPKPPVVITQDSEQAMRSVVIEVAAGNDVVDAVVNFARRSHVGISVIGGSGTISNVTLRHPYSHSPALTLHGPFTLLAFTGSYITAPFTPSSSPVNPVPSSFAVSFSGSQGQIFGGVVAGNLVAATTVVVVASVFKKPEFHRVGFNGTSEGDGGASGDGDQDNAGAGGGGINHGGSDTMSSFNAVTPSAMACNIPAGDVNVMQWGHTLSSSLTETANY